MHAEADAVLTSTLFIPRQLAVNWHYVLRRDFEMIYIRSSSSKNTVHHFSQLSKIIPIFINVCITKLIKNINKPLCTMMQRLRALSHFH